MALQTETDLPPGLACLKNVDALLRCPICFDFLNISMMTKCSHNFCSLCIRKFFAYKLLCPVCNAQATEQDLRNNRLLDDLVINFQTARQQLSKANFDSPPISPKTPASAVKCKTPRERSQKCNSSVLSHFFQKRPKTSPTKDTQRDGLVSQCVQQGKIQTTSIHNANDADLHSVTAQLPVNVKEEPMDVGESSIQGLMSVKQEETASNSIDTWNETAHSSSPSKDVKPVIKVECPVCSVSVSQQFINKHLDTCLTSGEKKESLRSSLGKVRRPMGKLVYNLLSMQELKRRLKECHLSVQGSRDQMIKRHQEFVHMYNAQCDSTNPKSAEDIAKEVEASEKIRNQLKGKAKPVMIFSKNQSEKEIEELHSNYRKQHSSDFSRLIAQVRSRLETTRQTRIKQEVIEEGKDTQKTHSADQVAEPKSCLEIKIEDDEVDEEPSTRRIELSPSPANSDVSISSSISDIFGPEPTRNLEYTPRSVGGWQERRRRDLTACWNPLEDRVAEDWSEDVSLTETKVFTSSCAPAAENHITPVQRVTERTAFKKRTSSSRESDAASSILGKRRRKM
ncbi:E3 ubiquitin-protein ligase RAD18 isoform X2 [Thunnus maccoyii]|uniref:E3 ubiquitin-protein ligase RAD18 isoform X2 n=1 Tax=Thunnus maccoyii TaxID=8240 RepID=UPI001C4B0C1B|nr:E3 ubiquitin-protein ligase RAD18 isoform X2 [Thunnus maccoyii]